MMAQLLCLSGLPEYEGAGIMEGQVPCFVPPNVLDNRQLG